MIDLNAPKDVAALAARETSRERLDRMNHDASRLSENQKPPATVKIQRDGPMFTIRTVRDG